MFATRSKRMSELDNKALVRRYYDEVLNQGQLSVLDQIAAHDYVEHDPLPGQGNGRDDLRARVEMLRAAFKPQFSIEDIVAEGDRVVIRWMSEGTHVGEFMGIPPTGARYRIAGIDVHAVRGGRMAEHWHVVDQLSQLQQLGVIPRPDPATA